MTRFLVLSLALLLAGGEALGDRSPLVVTGRHHPAIAAALPAGVEVLHNSDWAEGRTGGIRRAARRRAGRDLCLAPVDVPAVPPRVFASHAAFRRCPGCGRVYWEGTHVGRIRRVLDALRSEPDAPLP